MLTTTTALLYSCCACACRKTREQKKDVVTHILFFLLEFAANSSLDKHIAKHKGQPNLRQSLKWAEQIALGNFECSCNVSCMS